MQVPAGGVAERSEFLIERLPGAIAPIRIGTFLLRQESTQRMRHRGGAEPQLPLANRPSPMYPSCASPKVRARFRCGIKGIELLDKPEFTARSPLASPQMAFHIKVIPGKSRMTSCLCREYFIDYSAMPTTTFCSLNNSLPVSRLSAFWAVASSMASMFFTSMPANIWKA